MQYFKPQQVVMAILAMAVGSFGIGIGEFVIMGLLPNVGSDFGMDDTQTGYLISLYALGVVVGAPLITISCARIPRKPMLLGLMLVFALSNWLSAAAESFTGLMVLRFISGLPHGAFFGIACLVAADMVTPKRRAMAVTWVMMGLTIAVLIGNPLATWFGQLFSWRDVFHAVALIALLTVLLVWLVVPVNPNEQASSPLQEMGALKNEQVWLTLAIGAIGFGGMFAVLSYIASTVTISAGVDEFWVPVALLVFGVGSLIGSLTGGWAADRSLKRTIGGSLLWSALVLACFPLMIFSLWTLLPMVLLVGTVTALVPALQIRLMDVGGEAQTLAASLNHSAFNLANALGAWLGGLAIMTPLQYQATGWVGCGLALAGFQRQAAQSPAAFRRYSSVTFAAFAVKRLGGWSVSALFKRVPASTLW
ncbi:MFS transporter [Idiomarina xiamenensis]|uniref:Arabinose efflux permease n=1 Tax=Idiomarina xiamenensis 10-D-4 TaxID=740709 RepID=K2JJY8_9GAMM|nr:MFS transporter [Idiomarina xiamenensis]EKE83741.1 arabinose efflux permease [Idiomarina xiamenensis 10-D-4]